jgi:hypothetical protein
MLTKQPVEPTLTFTMSSILDLLYILPLLNGRRSIQLSTAACKSSNIPVPFVMEQITITRNVHTIVINFRTLLLSERIHF